MLGNQTVAAGSVSTNNREGRGLFGSGSNSSRSVNMIARPLMTPDELQLLPFGKMGRQPARQSPVYRQYAALR
ncbi:MAG: type IV secretory system conjugative DNA transfer family protein [Hominenteromicrobium sp.]|uniref:type IV secretory system conjugative DNA transfer family protein n=1 Tax=Hominenteromicrobium sp. TaxID=3073581 RepID=UPI003994176D